MKIKIDIVPQVKKPVFLFETGSVVCGRFTYNGRYKKRFKEYYFFIKSHANTKPKQGIIDVSKYKQWDAISVYDYVAMNWHRTISLPQLEKFANQTEIAIRKKIIKKEFVRAVNLKWGKIFKASNSQDPNRPKVAWQIL